LPRAGGFSPRIGVGIETTLNEGHIDKIFWETVLSEKIFHEGDIFFRSGEPIGEDIFPVRLKILDELFDPGIDHDGNIEFGSTFRLIPREFL
jgi:hypothetical protein